jgi:hypothetical protein
MNTNVLFITNTVKNYINDLYNKDTEIKALTLTILNYT